MFFIRLCWMAYEGMLPDDGITLKDLERLRRGPPTY